MTLLKTQIRPARTVDLPGLAAVLQDAFSDKMRVLFSKQPEKVRTVLEAVYTGPIQRGYDGVLVAERGGRIIGTLLIEPMYYTPEENRQFEHIAVRELGMLRTLWASFLLSWMSYKPQENEAYISDLGVASDCQGEGVGRQLLDMAEEWARTYGRTRLTLRVAGTNARAIHVYETMGFPNQKSRGSWLLRVAFGIRMWHFMEKTIEPLPHDPGW